jgi:aryl-alcohol dehydrogenase-like predicted oxidoreductase
VTPWDITADLHDTLARMQVDCVDLYVLHRDDPSFPVGPIVETLNEHVRAGKIKAFGGSNWTHQRIREANEYARQHDLIPFTVTNPNYSLAIQEEEPWAGCVSISGPDNEEARDYYRKAGMPVFSWSSLGSGFFSGRISRDVLDPASDYGNMQKYLNDTCRKSYCSERNFQRLDRVQQLAAEKGATVPQVALAYIFNQDLDVFALAAPANFEEFSSNVKAFDLKLTPQELAWLDLRANSPA